MDRIVNSWKLVKASWQVLLADKELVVFPIASAFGVILVTLAFLFPMIAAGFFDALLGGHLGNAGALGGLVAFIFYLAQYAVILFANSALVSAAVIRLEGGDPTLTDGFNAAVRHLGPILGYALIAATVGVILRGLSRRSKGLGRLVVSLVGVAWNLTTFLVVPVLVVEGLGPLEAVRRSAELLKRTWGEQIAGNLSINAIFGLAAVALTVLVMAPAAYLAIELHALFVVAGIGLLVPVVLVLALLSSTMNGIYSAALYRYATTGDAGQFFSPSLVQAAFRPV